MLNQTLLAAAMMACIPGIAFAEKPAPVAEPNGHLAGEVDGKPFDLPVM